MTSFNYKQFQINTISDALLVLGSLVTESISNINKFDEYANEAIELFSKYEEEKLVPAKEYEDIFDKVIYRQRELLALMADEAKDVFSYRVLRKWLKSHDVEGEKLITKDLEQNIAEILNELHEIRNWTFHNVQSRLVAEKEYMEHQAEGLKRIIGVAPTVTQQLNPLYVVRHKFYTIDMLFSFIHHNAIRYSQFMTVIEAMKKDYQEIYEMLPQQLVVNPSYKNLLENCSSVNPVKLMVCEDIAGADYRGEDIANLSMAMQKRKYDGSREAYHKYTINS